MVASHKATIYFFVLNINKFTCYKCERETINQDSLTVTPDMAIVSIAPENNFTTYVWKWIMQKQNSSFFTLQDC